MHIQAPTPSASLNFSLLYLYEHGFQANVFSLYASRIRPCYLIHVDHTEHVQRHSLALPYFTRCITILNISFCYYLFLD